MELDEIVARGQIVHHSEYGYGITHDRDERYYPQRIFVRPLDALGRGNVPFVSDLTLIGVADELVLYEADLVAHDWTYEYSDDHRVWQRGRDERERLRELSYRNAKFGAAFTRAFQRHAR